MTGLKRASLIELTSMAVEILEGLVQLHGINVWHLDLKPANILLDEYQHADLADFGISVALQKLQRHCLDHLERHPTLLWGVLLYDLRAVSVKSWVSV